MKPSRTYFILILIPAIFTISSCKISHHTTVNQHNTNTINNNSTNYKIYSDKLGVIFNGSEDLSLLRCVSGWLGTPYKYGGNTKEGTDCSGMVLSVFNEVYNIKMYRSSADQLKNVKEINKSELKAGDLIFFKIDNHNVSHVGIYLGENKFIHASTKKGVVVNSLDDEYYKKYYYTSGRVIGVPEKPPNYK
jgi:hypothetical protein